MGDSVISQVSLEVGAPGVHTLSLLPGCLEAAVHFLILHLGQRQQMQHPWAPGAVAGVMARRTVKFGTSAAAGAPCHPHPHDSS